MEISSHFFPAVASIAAALIAGTVAFLASIFSKEAKVSEFRQAWIDGLRGDFSELISLYYYIAGDIPNAAIANESSLDWSRRLKEEFLRIELIQARIELRLNPEEHAVLVQKVREPARPDLQVLNNPSARVAKVRELTTGVQDVLKKEWRRVKRGEIVYRVTKWISLIIAAVALIGLAIAVGSPEARSNNSFKPTPLRGAA